MRSFQQKKKACIKGSWAEKLHELWSEKKKPLNEFAQKTKLGDVSKKKQWKQKDAGMPSVKSHTNAEKTPITNKAHSCLH